MELQKLNTKLIIYLRRFVNNLSISILTQHKKIG